MTRLAAPGAAAALPLLLLLGCRVTVPFAERLFFSGEEVPVPRAADCERCHQEVYREWEGSPHALAWTSRSFRAASAERRAPECLACHAAAPLEPGRPPRLREEHRAEGVTCITCHLAPGEGAKPLTMRGPVARSSPIEVHPVIEPDPLYRSSELCGTCHRGAFEEWRAADAPSEGEKAICQSCHMPSVHRTVESVHDEHAYSRLFVALERDMELRRHRFAVPEDAGEHLSLRAEPARGPEGAALRIVVDNDLPHALPTGRFGRHAVELRAAWPGGARSVELASARGDPIPAGGERRVSLPLPEGVPLREVTVTLRRWDGAEGRWAELLRAGVAPPSAEAPKALPPATGG